MSRKCGVTQEALYLSTTLPSAKILPLKRHTTASEVTLKHGPEISTCVPPRTNPLRGVRAKPPENKNGQQILVNFKNVSTKTLQSSCREPKARALTDYRNVIQN